MTDDTFPSCGATPSCEFELQYRRVFEAAQCKTQVQLADFLILPHWQSVIEREYDPWDREHVVVDTAKLQAEEAIQIILELSKIN